VRLTVSGCDATACIERTASFGVNRIVKWRATVDEDGHYSFAIAL